MLKVRQVTSLTLRPNAGKEPKICLKFLRFFRQEPNDCGSIVAAIYLNPTLTLSVNTILRVMMMNVATNVARVV